MSTPKDANYFMSRKVARIKIKPQKCAANLGFQTVAGFFDWLDSPQFKPFFLKYCDWKKTHDLSQQTVKPYLRVLDEIAGELPEDRCEFHIQLITGQSSDDWLPHFYSQSALLQVYFGSQEQRNEGKVGVEFPLELQGARWWKLWNVFRFCTATGYFDRAENIKVHAKLDLNKVLDVPSYMRPGSPKVHADSPNPEPSDTSVGDVDHFITWDNMDAQPKRPELGVRKTQKLPPLHNFDDYGDLLVWITRDFRLKFRHQKIDPVKVVVMDGPEKSREARDLEDVWEAMCQWDALGYRMSFSFSTQDDLDSPGGLGSDTTTRYIPVALRDTYFIAEDARLEAKRHGEHAKDSFWWEKPARKRARSPDDGDEAGRIGEAAALKKQTKLNHEVTHPIKSLGLAVFQNRALLDAIEPPEKSPTTDASDETTTESDIVDSPSEDEPDTEDSGYDDEDDEASVDRTSEGEPDQDPDTKYSDESDDEHSEYEFNEDETGDSSEDEEELNLPAIEQM